MPWAAGNGDAIKEASISYKYKNELFFYNRKHFITYHPFEFSFVCTFMVPNLSQIIPITVEDTLGNSKLIENDSIGSLRKYSTKPAAETRFAEYIIRI